jgi:hypothetical protein
MKTLIDCRLVQMFRISFLQRSVAAVLLLLGTASAAFGLTLNTNVINDYNLFATGGTVQTFESISGMTPLSLSSYANALNSSTNVGLDAQLGLDIGGLLFHSGGGSFNNPTGNPGTPTALLQLTGGIAGNAHSATNVVGSLEINTTLLDLDNFIEIVFINTLQNRVGVWLNPALGNVTFTAFDSSGNSLESVTGNAGNFVAVQRATADIKFVSIVGGAAGFTIDDLTFAGVTTPTPKVPEPSSLSLLALGCLAVFGFRRQL